MPVAEENKVDELDVILAPIRTKPLSRNAKKRLSDIIILDEIDNGAAANGFLQRLDEHKMHPVRPKRGEVYLATITTGAGSELSGQHLVVIISNNKGNLYASKVIATVIEGDGKKINPAYHVQLSGADLDTGRLDKDPSRIMTAEIITIDKARLKNKIGMIKPAKMAELNKILLSQLSLN